MGKNNSGSYAHKCYRRRHDEYEIFWTYDRKYEGSRLRYPHVQSRWTDEAGARRFCKRWGIAWAWGETPSADGATEQA